MGFGDVGKNLIDSLNGKVETAYILFRKYDANKWKNDAGDDVAGPSDVMAGLTAGISTAGSAKNLAKLKDAAGPLLETESKAQDIIRENGGDYIPIKVQYNPSTLRFSSRGGKRQGVQNTTGGSGEAAYMQIDDPSETTLSMDLILDDTNINDAFMGDAFNLGASFGNVAQKLINIKEHSVLKYSELFIACMMRSYSRVIGFVWNKMAFWGELNYVEVTYTMFNNKGEPIRSKISVKLRQDMPADVNEQGEPISYATEAHWEEAFNKLFDSNFAANNDFGVKNVASNIIGF